MYIGKDPLLKKENKNKREKEKEVLGFGSFSFLFMIMVIFFFFLILYSTFFLSNVGGIVLFRYASFDRFMLH